MSVRHNDKEEIRIILAGVPNVGKSTVFNAMTGMKQHTGNWTGKTVECASGTFVCEGVIFNVTDIPGTYSLYAHSAEEVVARDCIVGGNYDLAVVVCDAVSPERSLPLVLQILEITCRVLVFFNLADEGKRCGTVIDAMEAERLLGVPVLVGTAKNKKDVAVLQKRCIDAAFAEEKPTFVTAYPSKTEAEVQKLEAEGFLRYEAAQKIYLNPEDFGLEANETVDGMACAFVLACDEICSSAVERRGTFPSKRDAFLDRLFTGKYTAFPVMSLFLIFLFWLTVKGANYPSAQLWNLFCGAGELFESFLFQIHCPSVFREFLINGVYRVTTWIISVMLPPMAIFFPLFTLLEDFGYLPRIAFDLDRSFKKCGGCGKQALCMCMGLGCNAVGVTGCRIIDSRRERLIAMLTNSMIPCNGRFPLILTLAAVFFGAGSFVSAVSLFTVLILSVLVSLGASKLLAVTLLKGTPSSFALELPPFRMPRVGRTLVRSVLDRTVLVLGRALVAAVPAGAVIWIFANTYVGQVSILSHMSSFLDPIGRFMGLDGVILCAFILGFPANETVLPIALMGYLSDGVLPKADSYLFVSEVLRSNGWTMTTAICVVIFSLFHWPCATTLMTVKKESGSFGWTLLSAVYPTCFGILLCALVNYISKAFDLLF